MNKLLLAVAIAFLNLLSLSVRAQVPAIIVSPFRTVFEAPCNAKGVFGNDSLARG